MLDVSPYVELVTEVMEGLRGDAFLMAKDLGLSALMDVGPPTGLDLLVERIKEHVFPLRSHEARELFGLGQQASGILSFIGRRKRWWIQLKELDPEMTISTQCGLSSSLRHQASPVMNNSWSRLPARNRASKDTVRLYLNIMKKPFEGFKKSGPSFKALSSERSRKEQGRGVVSIGLLCR